MSTIIEKSTASITEDTKKEHALKQTFAMKQTIEPAVSIVSLSHDGRGIAKVAGKTIFIENALPGEVVSWIILRQHRRYTEGKSFEILEASPDRREPPCPHFEQCGGCQLQHLSSEAQLKLKQNVLLEQLQHFGGVVPEKILPPLSGPTVHYRRRARLGVKFVHKKDKLLVGFREKRSGKLADINSCAVLDEKLSSLIEPLQRLIRGLESYQSIPQIEVAVGDSETALVFRNLKPLSAADREALQVFATAEKINIYLQPGDGSTVQGIFDTQETTLSYSLNQNIVRPIALKFHPLDFIQINEQMNQKMLHLALELLALDPNDTVLDLFCGLGNFTLPLALSARHVVGVEGSLDMIKRAEDNARLNHISNVEFRVENLQAELLIDKPWIKHYDKILIDPPRTGAEVLMSIIPKMTPKRIVYVSCNPATLARDIGILVSNHNYRLVSAGIMDMFPHTAHVESIAVLEK